MVEFSADELALLRDKVVTGDKIDPVPKIPDAPDISEPPTEPEEISGLVELKADERPVIGRHFVVWGSVTFDDIRERPVKRVAVSEEEYARKMRRHTEDLVSHSLKDPDPAKDLGGGYSTYRADRAEQYARWRYKGFVCGEVHSL